MQRRLDAAQARTHELPHDYAPNPEDLNLDRPIWTPTPRQTDFLIAREFETLFGGAAGGGKTDSLLVDAMGLTLEVPSIEKRAYQAIIFRRTFPDLKDIIDRSHELYPQSCEEGAPKYDKQAHVWTWPSGARIEFGYIAREAERFRYRGRAFQYVGWEELTLWPTAVAYLYLMSRIRSSDPTIPLFVRSTTNPDGPGFSWVKDRFRVPVNGAATLFSYELEDPETGEKYERRRRFIPSRLKDNPHLGHDYRLSLLELSKDDQERLLQGLWKAPVIKGAYYLDAINEARAQGRIGKVPYSKAVPVNTFWDLGVGDTTAIWCHQHVALQHRFLKAYENTGESLAHYVDWLKSTGYSFGVHYLPHDADHRRLGKDNVETWKQMLQKLLPGHTFKIVPRVHDVTLGINKTRVMLSEAFIDEEGCGEGLAAIENYKRKWDEDNQCFLQHPLHDWTSNYADAIRQMAQGWEPAEAPFVPIMEAWTPHDKVMGY